MNLKFGMLSIKILKKRQKLSVIFRKTIGLSVVLFIGQLFSLNLIWDVFHRVLVLLIREEPTIILSSAYITTTFWTTTVGDHPAKQWCFKNLSLFPPQSTFYPEFHITFCIQKFFLRYNSTILWTFPLRLYISFFWEVRKTKSNINQSQKASTKYRVLN